MNYKERLTKFYNEHRDEIISLFSNKEVPAETRKELNELIVSLVNQQVNEFDLTQYLFETEKGNKEDKHYLKNLKGIDVYWVAPGGGVLAQKFEDEVFEIPKAVVQGRASYSTDELKNGFVSTVDGIVEEISTEIKTQVQKYAADLYTAACAGDYTLSATSSTLEAVLDQAINSVYENTQKDTAYVLGRRSTLAQVSALGVSEVTKEERDKYGIIARFHDADLKPVPLIGRNKTALLPANRLFVCAADCGKAIDFGDVEADEIKIDHFKFDTLCRKFVGMTVVPSFGRAYVINIS